VCVGGWGTRGHERCKNTWTLKQTTLSWKRILVPRTGRVGIPSSPSTSGSRRVLPQSLAAHLKRLYSHGGAGMAIDARQDDDTHS